MFEKLNFKLGTIEKGPDGGRSLEDYEKTLHFKRKELKGETVLDLGTGPVARFSRELSMAGVDANVVSLSPDFLHQAHRQGVTESVVDGFEMQSLAAVGQELPFGEETFDRVLALFSVSVHAAESYEIWLQEMVRVLRVGGKIHVGPFFLPSTNYYSQSEHDVMKAQHEFVRNLGHDFRYFQGRVRRHSILVMRKR